MRKNVISLLLALVMLVSLTACGGDTPASDETDAADGNIIGDTRPKASTSSVA